MHKLLKELHELGGYYQCPEDSNGNPLGPLVGYAGKYEVNGTMKQFVGTKYFNFARGEQNSSFRSTWAVHLARLAKRHFQLIDYVVGMPMGGIMLATELGRELHCDTVFAEKKITALATATEREKFHLILQRHDLEPLSRVVLVEDVCNNFSTTAEAIKLLEDMGYDVAGIVCAINRSPENHYHGLGYIWPVVSVVHVPTPQYQQDDSMVAELVEAGKVIWKPKDRWLELMSFMEPATHG